MFLMIFDDIEMAKNIDFPRFCRTRYRSGCLDGNARKCLFYKEFVDGTDVPGFAIEHLFKNVNYAPIHTEQTFSNIS